MGFFGELNHARNQIYVISFVCFLCPGMFNALNSLPQKDDVSTVVKNKQNAALYICFAVLGLLGGGLNNVLGPRFLAAIGGTGYALYAAAQYNISVNGVANFGESFSIFSGAYLGVCGGMLWAAQGQICLTYPTESQKGTFFAVFWVIFNLGAVFGNIASTAISWNSSDDSSIPPAAFFFFIILMQCGSLAAMLIQPPSTIIREDFSKVTTPPTDLGHEFRQILRLFKNPALLTLLLPCMASNWFYTYQFNVFGLNFTGRSNNLKAVFYWIAQAVAAWVLGHMFLDNKKYPRVQRAWTGLYIVTATTLIVFGAGAAFEYISDARMLSLPKNNLDAATNFGAFIGPCILYAAYGVYDAFFQVYTNYLIGAISNDSKTLSRYSGFYKGTQSFAGGISWALSGYFFTKENGNQLTPKDQFWIMVVPCALSVVFWAVFVNRYVKNTTVEDVVEMEVAEQLEFRKR
ncbi:major facilitator superfamily domain-containing protein [Obelidium mucronatum]|nr:major facilitator superfamily domain-containing protein [Obelidium mucronatum]